MKQWIKWSVATVTMALTMASANAASVTGAITFAGGVQLNSGSVNTATAVTNWVTPYVQSDSGSFAVIPILTLNITTLVAPWNFNTPAPGINSFWTVSSGGETFTFNLAQSGIVSQGSGIVGVVGNGTVTGTGNTAYSSTPITWTFTSSDPGAGTPLVFSFQAANGATPDGGTTIMLLGGALTSLGLLKRKLMA